MAKLSLGSDPEFVLLDANKRPVSVPLVMGLPDMENGEIPRIKTRFGDYYADNVNLEFSPNPGRTKDEFVGNIRGLIQQATKTFEDQATLHAISSLDFPQDQLNHAVCRKFGCDPSFDAFTVKVNKVSANPKTSRFRSAGGHIHIGNVEGHDYLQTFDGKLNTVKAFELMLGIPSLLIDNSADSIKRRNLYGKAGDHRPKDYGVECRSLSNFWVQAPQLTEFVYESCMTIGQEMLDPQLAFDYAKLPLIINKGNTVKARSIAKQVWDQYPNLKAEFEAVSELKNLDKTAPLIELWK